MRVLTVYNEKIALKKLEEGPFSIKKGVDTQLIALEVLVYLVYE